MRILFITNKVASLYKDIEAELVRQGHEVEVVLDECSHRDPNTERNRLISFLDRKFLWERDLKKKWKKIIKERPLLRQPFDLLFVISGVSVNKYVMDLFESVNPNIRKVYYTWDTMNIYPFYEKIDWFDKAYSFDIRDVCNDARLRLLPIYYVESKDSSSTKKYDLFFVGANHDGRYSFVKKILPQLDVHNISSFIRIVSEHPIIVAKKMKILNALFGNFKEAPDFEETRKFSLGLEHNELLLREPLSQNEFNALIMESECVLDDQRETQTGLSARLMWALANGKKIITTNKWILDYPFVQKEQVAIIDKLEPILPIDFIKRPLDCKLSQVEFVRIDNWVKEILS